MAQPSKAGTKQLADKKLRAGLVQFGFVVPVLARREDRLIIGGHQRVSIALDTGARHTGT